jgi:hypothetical protein
MDAVESRAVEKACCVVAGIALRRDRAGQT